MLSINSLNSTYTRQKALPSNYKAEQVSYRLKALPAYDQVCFSGKKSKAIASIGPDVRTDPPDIKKKKYEKELKAYQIKLALLQQEARKQNKEIILVFEGWDAAGKGGAIKRVTEKLDPRGFKVFPVGAPTKDELNHHYLWRFWNKLQGKGTITIFDRSWYGRVLVERVENFATKKEWKRSYEEINNFEKNLADNGAVILKFFMDISKDEQLARFEARENDPIKAWKLTDEDWRNRDKWEEYKEATIDMYENTNNKDSKWHIIQGDCKKHARIEVLKIITDTLEKECDIDPDKFYPESVR
ncbi:MAG: UDP-galactose-lipid carrier transferase [Cyanobacteriota bacterium]